MQFQSATDKRMAETVFRLVQNAATATLTLTAASIARGAAVVMATATNSIPSSVTTAMQNFVQRAATVTSIVNNLFAGVLAVVPPTTSGAAKSYLGPEETGLAVCYGPYLNAIVFRATAGAGVGSLLTPNSDGTMIPVGGPVTAAATATAGHSEVPAIGGLAYLYAALGTSAATETTTAPVFVRAM